MKFKKPTDSNKFYLSRAIAKTMETTAPGNQLRWSSRSGKAYKF